jgi:hypothetical protein
MTDAQPCGNCGHPVDHHWRDYNQPELRRTCTVVVLDDEARHVCTCMKYEAKND